ncbi:hypothetical protein [Rubritalea tangerina]|uniref:hypothetical protein n=1 Tax=Rubritalea tangerina TaxID=430798 RepID=UPI00361F061A
MILTGYVVYGADPGQEIWGMNFETQAAVYAATIALGTICTVVGIYMLGAPFVNKLKSVFNYSEY